MVQEIGYLDLIRAFVSAGCVKLEKSTDKQDTLMSKYRQQIKKANKTVDALYLDYDPDDLRSVFKHDFINTSRVLDFDFNEDELAKIFQIICKQGTEQTESNDMQVQVAAGKLNKNSGTRFNLAQFRSAVSENKDENWLFQAYIKINCVVL